MITQTLDLNLIPGRVLPMVNASQYDKDSRTLEFTIYNGDQSFDLTGLTAYIQGLKPDGHGFNYSANISAGKITADVTEQMTAVSGRVMCEIIIMNGTDRIGTGNFILNVEAAAMPDGSNMSASEYAYIQELIEEAQEVVDEAEGYVEDAEAWARGTKNGSAVPATDPTYQNNSKYYSEEAKENEEDSEAWAVGTRNGSPVPATDPTYQNNAKYWSDQAAGVVNDMTGATASTPGTHGLVPAPAAGNQGKYLRGDGTWQTPTNTTTGDGIKTKVAQTGTAQLAITSTISADTTLDNAIGTLLDNDATLNADITTVTSSNITSGNASVTSLCKAFKKAGTVTFCGYFQTTATIPTNTTILSMPASYRPSEAVSIMAISTGGKSASITLQTNGNIDVSSDNMTSGYWSLVGCIFV